MRFLTLIVFILSQFIVAAAFAADPDPIRVTTFNIRYGTAPDGDNTWENRKPLVWEFLGDEKPQILGLQEALREQWQEIVDKLPTLVAVGVGREADGEGEYSALLYDRTRFDLLSAETFWLSDTPTVRGSRTWGADYTRICTWARLLDRTSNRVVIVMNTHWDHQSQPSRENSGELIARRVREFDPEEPIIVMGDFNCGPKTPGRQSLAEVGLRDSFVDVIPDGTHTGTFHGFTGKPTSDKIDAILVSRQWNVLAANIIRTESEGIYLSDHYPVTAALELKNVE